MIAVVLALLVPQGGSIDRGPGKLVLDPPPAAKPAGPMGPNGPAGEAPAGPVGPVGGIRHFDDRDQWQFWWAFNRSRFVRETKPRLPEDLRARIVATLKSRMTEGESRRERAAAWIAWAKSGGSPDADSLESALKADFAFERDAAVLAMGISGDRAHTELLTSLALNSGRMQRLANSGIPHQTRGFALYALGVTERMTPDEDCPLHAACMAVLHDATCPRGVRLAAVHSLQALEVRPTGDRHARAAITALKALTPELAAGLPVRVTLAKLLARHGTDAEVEATLLEWSREPIDRTTAIALGALLRARTDSCPDGVVAALTKRAEQQKDTLPKHLAAMALADVGGSDCVDALLGVMKRGSKAFAKPWAALALGAMHQNRKLPKARLDEVAAAVLKSCRETVNPLAKSAIVLALALLEHTEAAEDIELGMLRHRSRDEMAGYHAIAVGMLGSGYRSIPQLLEESTRRPQRFVLTARASRQLASTATASIALERLREHRHRDVTTLGALAMTLGRYATREATEELLRIATSQDLEPYQRACALEALGDLTWNRPERWNDWLVVDADYRSVTHVQTNQVLGIWDRL